MKTRTYKVTFYKNNETDKITFDVGVDLDDNMFINAWIVANNNGVCFGDEDSEYAQIPESWAEI